MVRNTSHILDPTHVLTSIGVRSYNLQRHPSPHSPHTPDSFLSPHSHHSSYSPDHGSHSPDHGSRSPSSTAQPSFANGRKGGVSDRNQDIHSQQGIQSRTQDLRFQGDSQSLSASGEVELEDESQETEYAGNESDREVESMQNRRSQDQLYAKELCDVRSTIDHQQVDLKESGCDQREWNGPQMRPEGACVTLTPTRILTLASLNSDDE